MLRQFLNVKGRQTEDEVGEGRGKRGERLNTGYEGTPKTCNGERRHQETEIRILVREVVINQRTVI